MIRAFLAICLVACSAAAQTAPTLTDQYHHILIEGEPYDDSLGATEYYNVYVHTQHSTTGAFTGEETTLAITPSRTQVQDIERNTDAWTDPLVWKERITHLNPATDTHHYRYRWERWDAGTRTSQSAWSPSASIAIVAPAGGPDIHAASWEVEALRSRVFLNILIGQTFANDAGAPDQLLISGSLLSGGWSGIHSDFDTVQALIPDVQPLIRGWSGNFAAVDNVSTASTTPVRYSIGPRREGGQTLQVDTSFAMPYDLKQAGIDLGGATGGQMEALYDDFLGADGPKRFTREGLATILYGYTPLNAYTEQETSDLSDYGRLGLTMAAGAHAAFDSGGRVDATVDATGENTTITDILKWRDRNHSTVPIWLEVVLFDAADVNHWLGTYENVNTIHLFDDLFDTYSGEGTLALKAGSVDPRDYPDAWHMIWIDKSSSAYVDGGANDTEDMERMVELALDLLAWDEKIVVSFGSSVFVSNNLTAAQGDQIQSAGTIEAGGGGGFDIGDTLETGQKGLRYRGRNYRLRPRGEGPLIPRRWKITLDIDRQRAA